MKKHLLKFVRKYYQTDLRYADDLLRKWEKVIVRAIIDVFLNGIVVWLVFLSILTMFPLKYPILGPGAWHILNIFQLGLLSWFFRELWKFIWRKHK